MTENVPKNHHYVPQHFLNAWQSKRGKLFRYRNIPATNRLEVRETAIRRTASEHDLYEVSFVDGSFEIESSIVTPKIDEEGHKVLEAARSQSVLRWSVDEKRKLANYLTCLEMRHPKILEAMNIGPNLDDLRRQMKSEGFASNGSIDEVIDYFQSSDSLGVMAFGYFAQNESTPLLRQPFSDGLLKANLRQYEFNGRPLLCSSYPMARWGDYLNDVFCVIAISPKKALIYSSSDVIDVFGCIPATVRANLVNLYTLAKAETAYFYDDSISAFVEEHLGWAKWCPTLSEQKEYITGFIDKEMRQPK